MSVIGWLCRSGGVYVVLRDLSLSVYFVAHGKLEVRAEREIHYLKVNKADKVVLFVLSGQCQLTSSLNSDRKCFNRWNENHSYNVEWVLVCSKKGKPMTPIQLKQVK